MFFLLAPKDQFLGMGIKSCYAVRFFGFPFNNNR